MWSFPDVGCHIGSAKSQAMESCPLAESQNCHLEEYPALVTVQENLDKAMGSSPRGITLQQQITACLKPPKGFCISSATNDANPPMSSCLPLPTPDLHRSQLHEFFIPIWIEGNPSASTADIPKKKKKIFRSFSLIWALHSLITRFRYIDTSFEMPVASRTRAQALPCFVYWHKHRHNVFNCNAFCCSESQPFPSNIFHLLSVPGLLSAMPYTVTTHTWCCIKIH